LKVVKYDVSEFYLVGHDSGTHEHYCLCYHNQSDPQYKVIPALCRKPGDWDNGFSY
jgi:hypothetical protein